MQQFNNFELSGRKTSEEKLDPMIIALIVIAVLFFLAFGLMEFLRFKKGDLKCTVMRKECIFQYDHRF